MTGGLVKPLLGFEPHHPAHGSFLCDVARAEVFTVCRGPLLACTTHEYCVDLLCVYDVLLCVYDVPLCVGGCAAASKKVAGRATPVQATL